MAKEDDVEERVSKKSNSIRSDDSDDLRRQGKVKVRYCSRDSDYDSDDEETSQPSALRKAFRWTVIYLGIPTVTVTAALAGGLYYGVTHADDINESIFQYEKEQAHANAPTYGQILTQLRIRNSVHRRYEEEDDMRRGVEHICSEINSVDGYECSKVIHLPRDTHGEGAYDSRRHDAGIEDALLR